jgi:predicted metalloprotease
MKKSKKRNNDEIKTTRIKRNTKMNDDYKVAVSFIIMLLIVLVCIGLLFFINGRFVTKDQFQNTETTTTTEATYDDTVILVSDILNQGSSKYYVMVYDYTNDAHKVLYSSLVSSFSDDDIKLYSVNLGLAFNSKYYNKEEDEKVKVSSSKDFNFTKPTLLVINKNKVTKAITDKDEIYSLLKD